jgi:NADH-quinone oxidoreductase subunit E
MSVSCIESQAASPETPGSKFFPPFEVTPALDALADECLTHYPASKRSATLPVLHIVQQQFGFISADAIEWVARKLGLEPIQVLEVVTFYPGFRQSAPGKFHMRICRTLSCAMGGSYELMDRICELTGIDRSASEARHQAVAVSPCGNFSVEFAECLASCGTAPVCMVNDDFHEGVHAEMAEALLEKNFPLFRVATGEDRP